MGVRILDFSDGFSSATNPSGIFASVATSSEAISEGGTITLNSAGIQMLKVNGSGGAVTTSTTPFGTTAPTTGTVIYLMGTDSANTVTLVNSDIAKGVILVGDMVLENYSMITLIYDGTLDRYIEIGRSF